MLCFFTGGIEESVGKEFIILKNIISCCKNFLPCSNFFIVYSSCVLFLISSNNFVLELGFFRRNDQRVYSLFLFPFFFLSFRTTTVLEVVCVIFSSAFLVRSRFFAFLVLVG